MYPEVLCVTHLHLLSIVLSWTIGNKLIVNVFVASLISKMAAIT
jgi:hypothetical protein